MFMPENIHKKIFYPTNDYIFRRIFGSSGNENITKDFLSSIIPDSIDSVSLSNNLPSLKIISMINTVYLMLKQS